jgi:hypothetical protein
MKIRLAGKFPDPVLVAIKAAVSWSSRCGQTLLPGLDGPDIDSEQEELYALGREEHEESMAAYYRTLTPTEITLGVSESSRRGTLSPGNEADGTDLGWENLEDDEYCP